MKGFLSVAALMFIVTTLSQNSQAPEYTGELDIYVNGVKYEPVIDEALASSQNSAPEPVIDSQELNCLALNIYHEARGETLNGKLAVASVTMNRVEHHRYPNTICNVVQQGIHYINWKGNEMPKRHQCQFSWYCDGKSDAVYEDNAWVESLDIALDVLMGNYTDNTNGATHYYNPNKADPSWAQQYAMTAQHGNHVFMSMRY